MADLNVRLDIVQHKYLPFCFLFPLQDVIDAMVVALIAW